MTLSESDVRRLAMALPEALEQGHFDRPSFRVRKRIFATIGDADDLVVLKIPVDEQEILLQAAPDTFVTNAWSKQGWLGVRLGRIEPDLFEELLENAWRRIAPKRAIRALEEERA